MAEEGEGEESGHIGSGAPEVFGQSIIAALSGIPPNIQKSLWKSVARVFDAGTALPSEYLKGLAKIQKAKVDVSLARLEAETADIKAKQKAREVIFRKSGSGAAALFDKPELAERALSYFTADMVREQENREEVVRIAAKQLRINPPKQDSANEIDDDWLARLLKEASTRSNQDFRNLFGKILAGEIKAPGSFSIATIQTLATLTKEIAELFQRACNISSVISGYTKIISNPFGDAGKNSLKEFGLPYLEIVKLIDFGLLRPTLTEWLSTPGGFYNNSYYLEYGGAFGLMEKKASATPQDFESNFTFVGPTFTLIGRELRDIVELKPNEIYLAKLTTWFSSKQLNFIYPTTP